MRVENIKSSNKYILFVLFLVLAFSFGSAGNVFAEKIPDFKTQDGSDLKVVPITSTDVEINEGCAGKLVCFDATEFKVEDSGLGAKIHEHILGLELIIEAYKKCDNKDCKTHYTTMFYKKQNVLAPNGIAIHVPKDLKDWEGKKHFWALTEEEGRFFNGEYGQLYSLALEDMEGYLGKAKIGEGCNNAEECFKKIKKDSNEKITSSYENKVKADKAEKEANSVQKELDELKDSDTSADKKMLEDYCKEKDADKSVCDLVKADKIEEAKKKYIPILEEKLKKSKDAAEKAKDEVEEDEAETLPLYTAPDKGSGKNLPPEGKLIVAYEGLFTQKHIPPTTCIEPEAGTGMTKGEIEAAPTEGKIGKIFVDIISGVTSTIADTLFGMDCPGVGNGKLSIVSEVLNIASPLNLTQNYIIMKLVSITQSLAYAFAIVLIVFYGVMYTTGYENMEPLKFGIRMFFGMILVYFLPYLMQDILNINNMIVFNLSQIEVTFDGSSTPNSFVFAGAIKNWIDSMTQSLGENLLTLILLVAMLWLAIQPLVKILMWWYVRMLKIFFYAIIGPIMVIMMALPQTSGMASKWLKDFIGETFSQVFMVLAMAMLAFIVGNMADFAYLTNLGWLGTLLVMYAAISFLAETPSIASSILGGIGGLNAGKLAGDVSRMPKKISNKAKQVGTAGKNGLSALSSAGKGSVAAKTGGDGAKTLMESMKEGKGITGKTGALFGSLAGKAYTAETSKGSMHQQVEAKVKPKIENIKSNLDKKKSEKQLGYQKNANAISQQAEEKQRENDVFNNRGKNLSPETREKFMEDAKSLNQQSAEAQLAAESNRKSVDQLKEEGSIDAYKKGAQPNRPSSGNQDQVQSRANQYQGSLGKGKAKEVVLGQSSGNAGVKRQKNGNGQTSLKVSANKLDSRIGTTGGGHRTIRPNGNRTAENSRKLKKEADAVAAKEPKTRKERKTTDAKRSTMEAKLQGTDFEKVAKINIPGEGDRTIPNEFANGEKAEEKTEEKVDKTEANESTNNDSNGNDSSGKVTGEDVIPRNASPEVGGESKINETEDKNNKNQNGDGSGNKKMNVDENPIGEKPHSQNAGGTSSKPTVTENATFGAGGSGSSSSRSSTDGTSSPGETAPKPTVTENATFGTGDTGSSRSKTSEKTSSSVSEATAPTPIGVEETSSNSNSATANNSKTDGSSSSSSSNARANPNGTTFGSSGVNGATTSGEATSSSSSAASIPNESEGTSYSSANHASESREEFAESRTSPSTNYTSSNDHSPKVSSEAVPSSSPNETPIDSTESRSDSSIPSIPSTPTNQNNSQSTEASNRSDATSSHSTTEPANEKQDIPQENIENYDDNEVSNGSVGNEKVNKNHQMNVDFAKVSEKYSGQQIVTAKQIAKDFNVGPRQARIIQMKLLDERRH